jgi:POT family proton-dependent oligopeptide transporter
VKLPSQIPFIIGNEACERFSFYGMRNILTVFLIEYLLVNEVPDEAARTALAKAHFHDFVVGVYFFPLIGGYLADRYWGKYRTIFWLSLVYCLGNFCLALFVHSTTGFFVGLFLIALGSGGIKPCVAAMVGDQFTQETRSLASRVFQAFYWSINLGSFFASAFIPKLLKADWAGPRVAFGIPGVLMLVATVIFWAGRKRYVQVPPTGPKPHGFLNVVWTRLRSGSWDAVLKAHPESAVDGTRAVLKVLLVFLPIPLFWALFDQKASTWVVQAKRMDGHLGTLFGWDVVFEPSQMQLINPLLVMMLVPLMGAVVYPRLKLALLQRMTIGMFVAASSWVVAGLVQRPLDQGVPLSIAWQLGPYVLLTLSEVMVSTSGLEFAYSQAPVEMKGTLMSFWLLTTAVGNLGVARASTLLTFTGAPLFFFWAGAAAVAAVVLAVIARGYVMVDRYSNGYSKASQAAAAS